MAIAVVQVTPSSEGIGVATLAVSFPNPTVAGNVFVAASAIFDPDGATPTPFTVTDSKSNSYTLARTQNFGTDVGNDECRLEQHYSVTGNAGAAHQITVDPGDTGLSMTIGIFELSGVNLVTPLNGTGNGGIANSTTPSSGAMTPATNGLFIAQMGYASSAKTMTPNWTGASELEIDENNDAQPQSILYKAASAASADTAAWTLNLTAQWGAQIVAYREALSGTKQLTLLGAG